MLFLLMQVTIASGEKHGKGLCNPWTEYVKLLPGDVPVPSLWNEPERVALIGTSLEVCFVKLLDAIRFVVHYSFSFLVLRIVPKKYLFVFFSYNLLDLLLIHRLS